MEHSEWQQQWYAPSSMSSFESLPGRTDVVIFFKAADAIFATIDPAVSYWRNAFLVMILIPAADTIFIVGNLFTISSMDAKSQALAGGLFSTATRVRCPPLPSSFPLVFTMGSSLKSPADVHRHRSCRHLSNHDNGHDEQIPRITTIPRDLTGRVPRRRLALLRYGNHWDSLEFLRPSRSRCGWWWW